MKLCSVALVLTLSFLALSGCARPRPCPPGYHLGPAGLACRIN